MNNDITLVEYHQHNEVIVWGDGKMNFNKDLKTKFYFYSLFVIVFKKKGKKKLEKLSERKLQPTWEPNRMKLEFSRIFKWKRKNKQVVKFIF